MKPPESFKENPSNFELETNEMKPSESFKENPSNFELETALKY